MKQKPKKTKVIKHEEKTEESVESPKDNGDDSDYKPEIKAFAEAKIDDDILMDDQTGKNEIAAKLSVPHVVE